jgi:hypothetical protein
LQSLLKERNGETAIIRYDQPTEALIFIAIYSNRHGPAEGGSAAVFSLI